MEQYFGVIEIIKVENIFLGDTHDQDVKNIMLTDHIRFVHYQDCQQMIVWLPDYFGEYHNAIIRNEGNNQVIFNQNVEDIINGRIQILIDTLFIPPGEYECIITKKDTLAHKIYFKKYSDGEVPEIAAPNVAKTVNLDSEPIVYRDGFGNILLNEDLNLKQNIIDKTINKFTRRLEYVSQGKAGEVIYIEGGKKITFYMEVGAYDCVFFLNIPSAAAWEKTTNFPLSKREDILTFVAEQTQRDQASSCTYKISDSEIYYYLKG